MKLKDTKACVIGIQGSGKTELAKFLCTKYKKVVWHLVHLDDIERMPKNVKMVIAEEKDLKELNRLSKVIIDYAIQGKIDCFVIDEADMFINGNRPLPKYINDMVINHRHYGLSVIFITRRPQDIPAKIIESCEHLFIFALPNSTNIDRKLNAIDKELLSMMPYLTKENHKFIYKKLSKSPRVYDALKLNSNFTMNEDKISIREYIDLYQRSDLDI